MKRMLVALGLVAACTEFEPVSRIVDFRLIAVKADQPFAAPGETVKITTLFSEPFARPITWAWTTCPLPRDTTVNACLARIAELTQLGQAPPVTTGPDLPAFDVTVPANILEGVPADARSSAIIGVLTVACPGTLATKELSALRTGELPFICTEAGTGAVLPFERFVVSVKRIYLNVRDRNQNPPITNVTWDGMPWNEGEVREANVCDFDSNMFGDCTGEKHSLAATTPPESREQGTGESGTPFREDLVYQYYASEGVFEFEAKTFDSPATQWAARRQSRGRLVDMWFVARDNRGGVSWTTRQVRVR